MKKFLLWFGLLIGVALDAAAAAPAALESWQPWLRERHPAIDCPRLALDLDQRRCAWPGRLQLTLGDGGAQFAQSWRLDAAGWIALPGDRANWPLQVTIDGRGAAVLERDGQPMLWLEPGAHGVRGMFSWNSAPQSIAVPRGTAWLELTQGGRVLPQLPDASGRLWLRGEQVAADNSGDAVKLEVFRRIDDGIPRELTTVLRLSVSGKARELRFGKLLLPGLEPLAFSAPLPARIEDDGSLRIQARAGEWEFVLQARYLDDRNTFRSERQGEPWPAQEIWSFAANPSLRRVAVSGATTLDPSQLDLPPQFAELPTYLMSADTELVLTEQYRGDATPAANALTLRRTVWVDFDGGGATVRDEIGGAMSRDWRLEMPAPALLGRVTVNGEPQLITRLSPGDADPKNAAAKNGAASGDSGAGFEIRSPRVQIDALSRVTALRDLAATNWRSDFDGVDVALKLPPGWKLWHASGPDLVFGSWLSQWNLWNIFLALLIVGSVFRLLAWRWALLALAAVVLTYHEADSPVLWLIPLLLALALLRVLETGKLRHFVLRASYFFGVALALVLLTFAVEQIRTAIYPQLELPDTTAALVSTRRNMAGRGLEEVVVEAQMAAPAPPEESEQSYSRQKTYGDMSRRQRYQPSSNVQTGPGIPNWSWRDASLQWSGPVLAGQPLTLYVTGPWSTRLLKLLDVLICVALSFGIARALWSSRGSADGSRENGTAPGALVALVGIGTIALLSLSPLPAQAEEFPPKYLLDELETRLLRAPECAPGCAAVEAAALKLSGDQLQLVLRVSAGTALGLPLPVAANWQPRSLLVDGVATSALLREGDAQLLPLAAGAHTVVLEGPLGTDELSLQFALPPHDVVVVAEQWDVFGINGRQLSANTLQLQRRERSERRDALLQAPAKPFVRVTRTLALDLDWSVTTRVERIAPAQGAINIALPLLPGEAIVSGGLEARDGRVEVSLGSQQGELEWRSVLPARSPLQLSAPSTAQWVESWIVAPSPRWHVESSGLTPVRLTRDDSALTWQPWPGEALTIAAVQPAAIAGATTTVEAVVLKFTPGRRGSALTATLDIRSSVGGDYRLRLDEPAELKRLAVDGADIAQARVADAVVVPLTPGANHVELEWQLQRGSDWLIRTPRLQLDSLTDNTGAASNIDLQLELPRERWPLWLHGPQLGPAMLYWGVLAVIVALACGLGALVRRLGLSIPLGSAQWLLLGIGMSTVNAVGSLPVLLWFFALEARRRADAAGVERSRGRYNLAQVGLIALSLVAAVSLLAVIPISLLSAPDMQVTGNGSHDYFYHWFQDRSAAALPQALVFSAPLWLYRLAMLLWSLWLVFALLRWIKWGWAIFAAGGLWVSRPAAAPNAAPSSAAAAGLGAETADLNREP